ncbi:MAG TPA: hypothetical protein VHT68_23570 [Pseudolabrys sp.]|jgi:hypothetical protein|nr:hypothetical protein [Pseudolabrys sp.]
MLQKLLGALAISAAAVCCSSANASVVYNLNFDNSAGTVVEGTGVLTLNLANVSDAYGLNTSNTSIFTSVVTGDIHSHGGFNLTPANISQFQIQTSLPSDPPAGHIYTLTVAQTVPPNNDAAGILILDLFTQTWQIHGLNNSTIDDGKLIVTGPSLGTAAAPGATPLPAALPLFATGLGALGFLGWRRKRRALATA